MQKILKSYLRRLTNLTASNRSLMLLRAASNQFVDLHDFNYTQGESSFGIINQLMGRKQSIDICPIQDARDEHTNKLSLKIKRLQRIERFIHEERGSMDLYVGWPFLRGKFSDGTAIRCPLMFFPVELDQKNEKWVLEQREEVNTTLNKSFLQAYAYFNKVKLSEDLLERVFDDFDTDSTVYRTAMYQLFKESPVEINFNPEIFSDNLHSFQSFTKKEFEDSMHDGEIKLFPEAVLGIFPQAGSHLVPDYLELIDGNKIPDLESFFAMRTKLEENSESINAQPSFLDRVKEEKIIAPYRLDAFQENALKAVKKGNSIVVQGPPGTGKSQLICNLIADSIAEGKKVLLVSQKRAALDVVYNRLEEKGVAQFSGLVHDFKNDRKALYDKISTQIEGIPEFIQRNNRLDIIQLERNFLQSSRNTDRISEELEEFRFALFDESESGLSVKELYLSSDRQGPVVNMRQEYRHFTFDVVEGFERKLDEYFTYAGKFNQTSYLLKNRKPFIGYGLQELRNMQDILDDIPKYINQLNKEVESVIGENIDFEECLYLLEREEKVEELIEILSDVEVYQYFQIMSKYSAKETNLLWLSNIERVLLDCFRGDGLESSLASGELGHFHEILHKAMEARKNPIEYLKWRLFSKDKYLVKRLLVSNGIKNDKKGFKTLVNRIDNRLNIEHNITTLREKKWIENIPKEYNKLAFQSWFHSQKEALKAKKIFLELRNFKEYFTPSNLHFDEFKEKLDGLYKVLKHIPEHKSKWLQYYSSQQISNITNDNNLSYRLSELLNKDFDALCEFDTLTTSFKSDEYSIVEKISISDDVTGPEQAIKLFQNSIRMAWIDHIEAKYPILRSTASMKFHKMVSELQQSVQDKYDVSADILLLRAREGTYQNVEYNRLNNMVTYRDLLHQVTKRRRVWPLRKLLSHFHEEIFDLLPCWMASPESVSAIFPMEQIFDLVIFDEASQCFSEKGIPAMYRGKQIVIAGDAKQLRPNDLYQVRWEEDETDEKEPNMDEDLALTVDSLLEMASPFLMNIALSGHYRSQSLDLIDFSNRHFYDGKLSMLPDKKVADRNDPAINYIKVNGIWENNTNRKEAEKVIELIDGIMKASPDKSIGVVTFNAKQQNHILDELEQHMADNGKTLPKSIFVKNIENVQGDEKDIIIFSTAYAKDLSGRLVMQFGSLNAEGGENRLNVAITRAREKIYVVSSITPGQLKVDGTKNMGPKLLKEYLKYALEVSNGKYRPVIKPDVSHSPKWFLKSRIREMTTNTIEDVTMSDEMPFADISVKQKDNYLGLIMTDDDLYYQALSVKEAHVYTPHIFGIKNWKYREIYSREFWQDPDQVSENIMRFINQNISQQ